MSAIKKETDRKITSAPGLNGFPGVTKFGRGYEFTVEVNSGSEAFLLLYEDMETEEYIKVPFPKESRFGNFLSLQINGIPTEIFYNYEIDGKLCRDPYARYLCNMPGFGRKAEKGRTERCGWKEKTFPWTDRDFVPEKLSDSVLYKLQVRSFTMHKNSRVRKKGSFQAVEQKIPYLKELGITGVLLMPAYEYRELKRNVVGASLPGYGQEETERVNCWGYTGDACYFAPKSAFCASSDPVREFKHLVNAMHEAGIECLMEFYFDGSVSPSMMLDILRYWKREYHIDGFHCMGQGICQELFVKDGFLSGTKLFFHDTYEIPGTDRAKINSENLAEYNEGYLYCMRRMLKGDENMMDEFLFRNRRNPVYSKVINYLADQDGFTMKDMVSYEQRHNEANGEDNRDGVEYNCTWNCGAEGNSRKQSIKELRLRQLKNAFLILLSSQGTPLIYQGDEWGNSQQGNNNVWCQDNETGWIDWNCMKTNKKLFEFVKAAISFRKENKILHMEEELRGVDYKALGYPDISYHGNQAWFVNREPALRCLGMMYCKDYSGQEQEFIYIAFNFHWMSHELALPGMPEEISWKIFMRTDEENEAEHFLEDDCIRKRTIEVPPRTILILTGKQEEKACGSGNILRRLQGTSF